MKTTVKPRGTKDLSKPVGITMAEPRSLPDGVHERIASKAYELWELRGCRDGHALRDWLDAESLVMDEIYEARR
jgi:hypothetical protein